MLAYVVKNSKAKPSFLNGFKVLGYDIPAGGKIWHLDLPDIAEVPSIPADGKGLVKTQDENISYFKFGRTPEPSELLKRKYPFGNQITLGDGRLWHVPMVRNIFEGTLLPRQLVLTDEGEEQMVIKQEYLAAWQAAETIWKILDGDIPQLPRMDILKIYATILGVNYWITPYDVIHYGLFCDETKHAFYYEVTDAAKFKEILDARDSGQELPAKKA